MKRFIYVDSEALPSYFLKVLETKRLLESGKVSSVTKAAQLNGISRSAYYKYKDSVFEAQNLTAVPCSTFMLTLSHQTGVLSNVLSAFSAIGVSILTISQSLPVNDQASVMLTADMQNASCGADEVMQKVAKVNGVKQVLLLSMS